MFEKIILIVLGFIPLSMFYIFGYWMIMNEYISHYHYIIFSLFYVLCSIHYLIKNYTPSHDIKIVNKKKENIKLEDCVICLEEIPNNMRIYDLDCKHVFHIKCIEKWKEYSLSCPLCRCDIKIEIN